VAARRYGRAPLCTGLEEFARECESDLPSCLLSVAYRPFVRVLEGFRQLLARALVQLSQHL
jgi:hypothetical protein